jgi:ribosomal protein S4
MLLKKKRYSPLYKKFIVLRKNVQNRKKIFNFKKLKWDKLQSYLKNQFKWRRRKPHTMYNYQVQRFASFGNSFKRKFRDNLYNRQKVKLFYGFLKKSYLKKQVKFIFHKNIKNFDLSFLELLESRLDSVLYRAHFSLSMRSAQQMINHGFVLVNKKIIKKKSYILKQGDLIEIKPEYFYLVKNVIKKIKKPSICKWYWHLPPNYLTIKYRILQIKFGNIKLCNFSNSFPFWLNINSILSSLKH